MIINHGTFRLYTPQSPSEKTKADWTYAEKLLFNRINASGLFLRNEKNLDWYTDIADLGSTGKLFVGLRDGFVVTLNKDPSMLWPIDLQVVETDQTVEIGQVLSNDVFVVLPITADQIKAEAQRRIHARFPQWKQANMTARSSELFRIQAGFMRDADGSFLPARPLTAEEVVEEVAIAQAWSWIKAVRSASDSLEARSPVPQDYSSDAYWPK